MRCLPLLALLLAAVWIGGARPADAQTVVLEGRLVDEAGAVVSDRTVQFLSNLGERPRPIADSTMTDADGRFRFRVQRTGRFVLRVGTADLAAQFAIFTDEAGSIPFDVILAEGQGESASDVRYQDPQSRPARFARALGPNSTNENAGGAAPDDIALAEARMLAEALRLNDALSPDSAATILTTIPPDSPVWTAAGDQYLVLKVVDQTDDRSGYADYLERYVMEQADADMLPGILFQLSARAAQQGDEARLLRLLSRVHDGLADTFWGSRALAEFGPDRVVREGEPVPDFVLPLLPLGSDATVTAGDLAGTPYLLDFWASWCIPCIEERDALRTLYEDFSGRGFEIVSITLDSEPKAVAPIRERWPMPWTHAAAGTDYSEVENTRAQFGLVALPKLVLVDADGVVVAGGAEVRPEDVRERLGVMMGGEDE